VVSTVIGLINSLEGRDSFAFVFVQGVGDNASVSEFDIRFSHVALECQGVLHPFFVITLWSYVK